MTLEEADGRVDAILMEAAASGEEHPPAKRDAEALRVVLAVARAFPKMLSALEAERKNGNPRWNAIGAEYTPTCGQCGAPDEPTGQDHSDDCLIGIALRAAREAVKP